MNTVTEENLDPSRRIEELGRIILAYSDVTEKLQVSHGQLTETVQRLRQELSEKNQLLERRNRLAALGEMAAGMAHEIRNPLGGIQLYASLLAKDLVDREDCMQTVRKISGGVKRLDALVSQVLQFSREMTAHAVDCDVAEVVSTAIDFAAAQLLARQVHCQVSGPETLPVHADPLLLGQAILNLVLNAAEAIEANGTVHVRFAAGEDKQFWLQVQDTGPGIPPAILDRIFNPFFTTKDTGTGLGLAIVHRIVEAHDGTITATNVEGGGARFDIRI